MLGSGYGLEKGLESGGVGQAVLCGTQESPWWSVSGGGAGLGSGHSEKESQEGKFTKDAQNVSW